MSSRKEKLPPIHPGKVLKEEFMVPLALSANQLALKLHVPAGRITSIVNGERIITPDTALRLSRLFGTSPEFWLNLQSQYDLQLAEDKMLDQIDNEVRPLQVREGQ